jgi:hypothetical protein
MYEVMEKKLTLANYLEELKKKANKVNTKIKLIEESGLGIVLATNWCNRQELVTRNYSMATGYENYADNRGTETWEYDFNTYEFPRFFVNFKASHGKVITVPIQHATFNQDIPKMSFHRVYGKMGRTGPWGERESEGYTKHEYFFDESFNFFEKKGVPDKLLKQLKKEYEIARRFV